MVAVCVCACACLCVNWKETNTIDRKIKQTGGPETAGREVCGFVCEELFTDKLIWIETGTQLHSKDLFCKWSWLCVPVFVSFSPHTDSFYDTFHTTADIMYFCQMMAVLEVINPLLGLVKTGAFPAMIQVTSSDTFCPLLVFYFFLFVLTTKLKAHAHVHNIIENGR